MNYLGRPIFPFTPDWSDAVTRMIKYDLREGDIGYGAAYFNSTQDWTVNSWQFSLTLPTDIQIAAYEAFTAALVGPLSGFWLPAPLEQAKITVGTSTTVFNIQGEDFAAYWNARPDAYLLFTFLDGTQAAAQIQTLVTAGNAETVTLTAALPQIPVAGTAICKLHYVRLASDEESFEFFAENQQTRTVSLVELPEEYAAAQVTLSPIYLFEFNINAPINALWCYTSFAAPVVSQATLYNNWPIDFSDLTDGIDGSANDLKIQAEPNDEFPFSLFFPMPFSGVMYVNVYLVDYATPDNQTLLFSGRVTQIEDDGMTQTATCQSRLGYFARKGPRLCKGQTCQNVLGDQNTCRVGLALFSTSLNIASVSAATILPPEVTCTFLLPEFQAKFEAADYLAQGLFESGEGTDYEARTIIASSYNAATHQLTLTLNMPLILTEAGANCTVTAGCDHTLGVNGCAKFNNQNNYVGFIDIPDRNPVIKAVNANSVSQGGK